MFRIFNFSAGPAMLPVEVLQQAASEMTDWHDSGMSVMEMSHRGKEFISIHAEAEADLRELLAVPKNYKVLFLQGGAIGENAIVPMNLLRGATVADYVNTGEWSKKSIKEAKKYCTVNVAASSEDRGFTYIPARETWKLSTDAAYVHICSNETIGGIEYHWTPDTGDVPLVADMSSHILSRPVDVARYGLIYAGAQNNIAKAKLLYDYLEQSEFFVSPVDKQDRSRMNVPFKLKIEALDEEFLNGAKQRGMVQLKGHRSVGGMRASIYNAMPIAAVQALAEYMREFEAKHG